MLKIAVVLASAIVATAGLASCGSQGTQLNELLETTTSSSTSSSTTSSTTTTTEPEPVHPMKIEEIRDQLAPETIARLEGLGIKEVIGEFTTYYKPGQLRVINIELIADLVRDVIIEPGEIFSLNEFVGPRTIEKGFVSTDVLAPDIGLLAGVGGGISQFTTALFNAAFFAGLELIEYKAHSYYFARYPYGRESTINYPTIDLKIQNITPNGILIWNSYTEDSTTVQLFGTPYFIQVNSLEPRIITPREHCTHVETFRSRTYPNGETIIDSVFAIYQPELGENPCP